MSDDRPIRIGCGGSLPVTATVVMVVLKLAGVVDWSWWVVFAPVLAVGAIVTVALTFAFMIVVAIGRRGR